MISWSKKWPSESRRHREPFGLSAAFYAKPFGDELRHASCFPHSSRQWALDEFERQLCTWLVQIPSGRVVTYGQLAGLIGRPNGARWVGHRLGRLPAGSKLPWHRVLNARGCSSLPLEEGGSNRQLRLLQGEGVLVVDGRVSLARYRWDPYAG